MCKGLKNEDHDKSLNENRQTFNILKSTTEKMQTITQAHFYYVQYKTTQHCNETTQSLDVRCFRLFLQGF